MISRRNFLTRSVVASGALLASQSRWLAAQNEPKYATEIDPNIFAKFVDPLPIPPRAVASRSRPDPTNPKKRLPYYRVQIAQSTAKVHRDMKPTRLWAFAGAVPGPTFETRSGDGLLVEWVNGLPSQHFLPIDHKIHGAEPDKPSTRVVVHMHGAKTGPNSDGYPEDWIEPGKSVLNHYPNQQDAAMLWYHDHALGINRLNVYAGLVGALLIRDQVEDALNLPKGKYEVPLILFDRLFTQDGQLLYPISSNPDSPWVSEVYGNAILANGKLFPYLDVEARKYRLRILNAANSRFFNLSFSNNAPFHQIGTDQGLLAAPVPLKRVSIAPGERLDLVIDFGEQGGAQPVLRSDSFAIMQFRVSPEKITDESSLPLSLRPVPRIPESQAVKTRLLTLDEVDNSVGEPVMMLLNGSRWHQPITEKPVLNSTEIWSFMNPSDDSHPIHLHLVRFQILDRRRYEPWLYQKNGEIRYLSGPITPEPNEAGWKDTVRVDSRMITRIIVPFEGFTGRYVWHCHILEHEDNEMMRPYEVVAAG
jgi:spore coat protein A, manganese oxidase